MRYARSIAAKAGPATSTPVASAVSSSCSASHSLLAHCLQHHRIMPIEISAFCIFQMWRCDFGIRAVGHNPRMQQAATVPGHRKDAGTMARLRLVGAATLKLAQQCINGAQASSNRLGSCAVDQVPIASSRRRAVSRIRVVPQVERMETRSPDPRPCTRKRDCRNTLQAVQVVSPEAAEAST